MKLDRSKCSYSFKRWSKGSKRYLEHSKS